MKRKLLFSLCLLLPVVLLLAGTNLIVDPANLYTSKYESTIVHYLLEGKNVSNVYNYDERQLQKHFIQGLKTAPDIVVLGSSRIMLLNKDFFPGYSFSNSGVSGATINDLYSIFYLYEKNNKLPKKVILGLDPWLLNPNNGQTRWKSLSYTYQEARNTIKNRNEMIWAIDYDYTKLTEFLSLDYFQHSIEFLTEKKSKKLFPVSTPCNKEFTRKTDGSICYGQKVRNKEPSEVKIDAEGYISRPNAYLSKFDHIDRNSLNDLEDLISYMQKKGIEIRIVLCPYHPIVFNFFKENESKFKITEVEEEYKKLAIRHNIKLIGSFNPAPFGFDNSNFYDGMHFREDALAKMTQGKL